MILHDVVTGNSVLYHVKGMLELCPLTNTVTLPITFSSFSCDGQKRKWVIEKAKVQKNLLSIYNLKCNTTKSF